MHGIPWPIRAFFWCWDHWPLLAVIPVGVLLIYLRRRK